MAQIPPPPPDGFVPMDASAPPPPPAGFVPMETGQSLTTGTPQTDAVLAANRWDALKSAGTVDSNDKGLGMFAAPLAGLSPDPQKNIEIVSKHMGIPANRFGYDADGNMTYIDPDTGRLTMAVPTSSGGSWSDPLDKIKRIEKQLGAGSVPMIPQAAGAAAGAGLGPLAGPLVAGGVSAGTDLVRQGVANLVAGAPVSDLDYGNAAWQGAGGAVGQGLNNTVIGGYNALVGGNKIKAAGFDVARLRDPANLAKWQALQDEADNQGIWLSPGNITGAQSLLTRERQLGRWPESTNALNDAYKLRNETQVPNAVNWELGNISASPNAAYGARDLQQGAQDVISQLDDARKAAASPHYEAAFSSGAIPDVTDALKSVNSGISRTADNTPSRSILEKARSFIAKPEAMTDANGQTIGTIMTPETDYARLHSAKENIDVMLDQLKDGTLSADRKTMQRLTDMQQKLTTSLRNAHPEYETGYSEFINASQPLNDAQGGLVGMMASDRKLYGTLPDIFAKGDPMSIAKARDLFNQTGKTADWDSGVKAYLQNALSDAARPTQAGSGRNTAGKFYQDVWGDNGANLRAAMTPDRFDAFSRMMQVLKSAASSPGEGSQTATDIGQKAALASLPAKGMGAALKGIEFWHIPGRVGEWLEDRASGAGAEKLAEVYTNSDAMDQLRKLRIMTPDSRKAWSTVLGALETAGMGKTRSQYLAPQQSIPPILGQPAYSAP
jgi:hypothetical protein